MKNQRNVILGILLFILLILGFTNPDSNSHINAYLNKIEKQIEQDTLIRNIGYENIDLATEIRKDLLNSYKDGTFKRKNFIIFSKIDNISFGLLNYVWVIPDINEESIRRNLVYGFWRIIKNKFELKYYNDIILICNEVLKGSKNGYKVNGMPESNGFFNSYRARCNMILNKNKEATKDIILLEQNNLASDWDYYTGYSINDNLGNASTSLYYINKAIEKNDKDGYYFYRRAITNYKLGNLNESCNDIYKSKSLGLNVSSFELNYYCSY
jgi:hypothetical protein